MTQSLKNKLPKISYAAPLCITLAGHEAAFYGKPVLMLAVEPCIEVTLSNNVIVNPIFSEVKRTVFSKDQIAPRGYSYKSDYPIDSLSVQSALIVALSAACLEFKLYKEPSKAQIQKVAYEVEKKIFKHYSHAQTVASVQGSLVYYRKEFEFYKTVLKLPMKLPKSFLKNIVLQKERDQTKWSEEDMIRSEKQVKRLILAIQSESLQTWSKLLPGKATSSFKESAGVQKII